MRVWLVSFALLFVLTQLLMWLKNYFVPFPLYVFGGACLALASNNSTINLGDLPFFTNSKQSAVITPTEESES